MNEAKRKRIIYAVFALAVLWGLYMQPWKRRERRSPVTTSTEQATTVALASMAAQPTTIPTPVSTVADWTVDPFRPIGPVEPNDTHEPKVIANAPVLQGTMLVRGAEVCVIDGRIHQEGDRAGAWTILKIDNGEVTLTGPNQERVTLNSQHGQRK